MPPGTPFDPLQHIRYKNKDYEIVGYPEDWDVDSSADHILLHLDRWAG